MNNGLSDKLKAAFPDIKPVQRPLVTDQEIKNPYWISGFPSGEGCFEVVIGFKPLRRGGAGLKLF